MSGALYVPPIANPVVHQEFEVPVEIVQTGNAFPDASELGHVLGTHPHHGQPQRLNRSWLCSNNHLNPSDVTILEVVVDVLSLINRVQEPDGSHTNAYTRFILNNPELPNLMKDSDPVQQLVIVPCGTSRPLLS
jgi:hypothetical protein